MTPVTNTITDMYTDHVLKDGTKVGIVRFKDMRAELRAVEELNLYCDVADIQGSWTYGSDFPTREDTVGALKSGRIVQGVLKEYDRQRKLIEKAVGISKFLGKGLSCKRKRVPADEGDELSMSRIMSGSDTYWMRTERNSKRKNVRIGVNFSLACGNQDKDFARLGGTLALLCDICYKLGFSVEAHGVGVTNYEGSRGYGYIITDTIIKKPAERMDIQRILSVMHKGLHRDIWFGLKDKLFDINKSSYGRQTQTSDELRDLIGLDYVIEQHNIRRDIQLTGFFEDMIHKLVDKKEYLR